MNKTLDKNYFDIFIDALNYIKCTFNEARSFSDRTWSMELEVGFNMILHSWVCQVLINSFYFIQSLTGEENVLGIPQSFGIKIIYTT